MAVRAWRHHLISSVCTWMVMPAHADDGAHVERYLQNRKLDRICDTGRLSGLACGRDYSDQTG
jgi:hypothetical protein